MCPLFYVELRNCSLTCSRLSSGWIDVMESVMNIKGRDLQPEENASQFNALLIVIYNLIGALFM